MKYKKIIMILIEILVILMIITVSILIKVQNVETDPIEEVEDIKVNDVKMSNTLERVTIRNDYFTVKNIVDQYYLALCNLNKKIDDILVFESEGDIGNLEEVLSEEKENIRKRIFNFFDKDYINQKGLTINNIQEKLGNHNNLYVLIEDMYVRDISVNLKLYFVSGTLTESENIETEKFNLVIAVDSNNSTFNIYTSEFVNKLEDVNSEYNLSKIENRIYNRYTYKTVNDEEYAKELLESYTQSIRYNNINYSYSRLEEEYKINRFKEKADYENYIKENRKYINIATLKYYKYNILEGYIQYICVDQDENYYIFNQIEIMNYKLILDPYTVDLPEFLDKYVNAEDKTKVALNIQKIKEAINDNNYGYVYSKLDATFRESNYSNYSDFQEYLKTNLFDENVFKYEGIEKHGDVYVANIIINETKRMNIIMKLSNDTDFYMSFSFQE